MNYSGDLSMIDLWYDWTNGRNFNIIQEQLGGITYDLEWNNGTSFVYTLDESKSCRSAQLEVGTSISYARLCHRSENFVWL